jgi:lysophospholipase
MDQIKTDKISLLNHSIFVRKLSAAHPTAHLFIAHGYAEHSGRYEHVMRFAQEKGLNAYAFDQLGHGNSSGERGYVQRFSDYSDGFQHFVISQIKNGPELPIFILGHSFGALIIADLLKAKAQSLGFIPAGLIFTSPFWWLKGRNLPKVALGQLLSLIRPRFNIPSAIDPFLLSHDRECCLRYAEDPLVVKSINANWFRLTMEKQRELREQPFVQDLPILTMVAGDDRLSDNTVAAEIFKNLPAQKKTYKVYRQFYHEILNESGKEQVLSDIWEWMKETLPNIGQPIDRSVEKTAKRRPAETSLS